MDSKRGVALNWMVDHVMTVIVGLRSLGVSS